MRKGLYIFEIIFSLIQKIYKMICVYDRTIYIYTFVQIKRIFIIVLKYFRILRRDMVTR